MRNLEPFNPRAKEHESRKQKVAILSTITQALLRLYSRVFANRLKNWHVLVDVFCNHEFTGILAATAKCMHELCHSSLKNGLKQN